MSKSMIMGVIAGVGIATAGGVAGYSFLGKSAPASNAQVALAPAPAANAATGAPAQIPQAVEPPRASVPAAPAPARAPAPAAAPRAAQAAAPAPAAEPEMECWDEEVVVTQAPGDQHAIAGTAVGAVVGGAIAKDVGDDKDLVTAAGAAAGAFIGRRLQRRMQDNRAEERTTTQIERRCAPAGSR